MEQDKNKPIKSPYVAQPSPMPPNEDKPIEKPIDEAEIARVQAVVVDIMRGARGFVIAVKELDAIDENRSNADGVCSMQKISRAEVFENVLHALNLSFEHVMILMLQLQQGKKRPPGSGSDNTGGVPVPK